MTREEVLEIIRNENLRYYNWFDDHDSRPEEVVICKRTSGWIVFTADERTAHISVIEYQTESEALEDFLKRLRAGNELERYYRKGT